jgi:hypothetical protein
LADTLNATVAAPCPLSWVLIEIQLESVATVQVQSGVVVTVRVALPPAALNDEGELVTPI